MAEAIQPKLTKVLSDVLANLAFMLTDDLAMECVQCAPWIEVRIEMHGRHHVELRLRCCREFSTILAGNLLGLEGSGVISIEQSNDATKELMNIICGQLATTLYGTQDIYNLTIPEVYEYEDPATATVPSKTVVAAICTQGFKVELLFREFTPTGS
ncbi:MAG: hypothetical protein HJJLKODD_01288 [Phycisphaerae bacterium]|nr:hypothetical protein [Phycisphaerae bacterium]